MNEKQQQNQQQNENQQLERRLDSITKELNHKCHQYQRLLKLMRPLDHQITKLANERYALQLQTVEVKRCEPHDYRKNNKKKNVKKPTLKEVLAVMSGEEKLELLKTLLKN